MSIRLRKIPSIPSLLKVFLFFFSFNQKWMFFPTSVKITLWFFSFELIWWITLIFLNAKLILHDWNKDLYDMLSFFFLDCWMQFTIIFLRIFTLYADERYWGFIDFCFFVFYFIGFYSVCLLFSLFCYFGFHLLFF